MKTLTNLFELITKETEMNKDKMMKVSFDINTQNNWVSMYKDYGVEEVETETIFSLLSIKTPEQIQRVYWTIFNEGRSRYQ